MKNLAALLMILVAFTAVAAQQDKEAGICFISKFDYPNNTMANVYYILIDNTKILAKNNPQLQQGAKNHEMIAVTVETNVNTIERETKQTGRWSQGGRQWDVSQVWGFNKEDYAICGKGVLRYVGVRQGRLTQFRDFTFYPGKLLYVGQTSLKEYVTTQKYALLERF